MTRWLVVGAHGQLGSDLMSVLSRGTDEVTGVDLPDIDITDPDSIRECFAACEPDVVVNAAAYTAVDAAEEDEEIATRVNGLGPELLAAAVAEREATRMVQISTDYVFSGESDQPYPEDAITGPQSAYGRSKLLGEQAVQLALPDRSYVLRTAWLYGEHGHNFVKTMLLLERQHETLKVVDDQHGQPTWSRDLAAQVVALINHGGPAGIYHATNSGRTTWCGLTKEIFRLVGADPDRIQPVSTEEFPRPAPRPAMSVLAHDRWALARLLPMRDWRPALVDALPRIQRAMATTPAPA